MRSLNVLTHASSSPLSTWSSRVKRSGLLALLLTLFVGAGSLLDSRAAEAQGATLTRTFFVSGGGNFSTAGPNYMQCGAVNSSNVQQTVSLFQLNATGAPVLFSGNTGTLSLAAAPAGGGMAASGWTNGNGGIKVVVTAASSWSSGGVSVNCFAAVNGGAQSVAIPVNAGLPF
jgi:hypothetical protein